MHFIVAPSFKWMALMLYFHTDFLIYMWTRSTVIILKRLSVEKICLIYSVKGKYQIL